jgi:uncharacterized protein (TIGR02001 family)
MKYRTAFLAAGLALAATTAAAGEFSSTVTAVSDYDFRGVSLSAKDPALQASLDWAHDSGFYLGAWASNIDYGSDVDGNIELDLIAGFSGEINDGLGYDLGIVWYTYPDSSGSELKSKIIDYPEIYAGLSWGPLEFKQWFTNDYGGSDMDASYSELNASFELPAGVTLNLHGGYNYGEYFHQTWENYFDYSVGLGYSVNHFDMELKVTGTELSGESKITDDVFNTEARVLFSISTTFPWAAE